MNLAKELKSLSGNTEPAVFIDRDGTINVDVGYISSPDQLELYPWAAKAVRAINQAGFKVIVVTNQSGVARGFYDEQQLELVHARLVQELEREGACVDGIYYCPHHPRIGEAPYRQDCDCRKPLPGLLLRAAREHGVALERSYVIGDKWSDIGLAKNVGAKSALVLTGYGRETLERADSSAVIPDIVADNLLAAVSCILDSENSRG